MQFLPLTYEDITTFLAAYPEDAEVKAYLVDIDAEITLEVSAGDMLRHARQHPPGFPVVPSDCGQYVAVGLTLSLPGPKFTLIPWEALKAQQGDGDSRRRF